MNDTLKISDVSDCYRINSPEVVANVIEGEAILISFETGIYYSSRGTGGAIVAAIQQCMPTLTILEMLAACCGVPPDALEAQLSTFLCELSNEGLIVPHTRETSGEPISPCIEGQFERPTLEKFEDLEDLLLLDPVHDIDAVGWPVSKART